MFYLFVSLALSAIIYLLIVLNGNVCTLNSNIIKISTEFARHIDKQSEK